MKPKPILFVDHANVLGGAEHSLLLLMRHLDTAAWQPHLACPQGVLADEAVTNDVAWHAAALPRLRRSPRFLPDWHAQARQLARIAQEIDAALLIANTVRAAFFTMWAANMARRPFIWHMRDFWLSENQPRFLLIDEILKKLLCRTAMHVIVNSAATASHLPCPDKISVIHNGIDLTTFQNVSNGQSFREEYDIPQDTLLVGTVGRLRPWKGQDRFIQMAAKVAQAQPAAHFVIVGGTPFSMTDSYPAQLKQLATNLGLQANLHFTGQLADVRPALAAMDIFVHPGDPEPFGLVNLEAMAMGKPVVAFAHGALPEIVVPNQTGFLVPPKDVQGLAQAVLTLLESPDVRQQFGQAGRQRAVEHFSIQQTAAQVQAVLQKYAGEVR